MIGQQLVLGQLLQVRTEPRTAEQIAEDANTCEEDGLIAVEGAEPVAIFEDGSMGMN